MKKFILTLIILLFPLLSLAAVCPTPIATYTGSYLNYVYSDGYYLWCGNDTNFYSIDPFGVKSTFSGAPYWMAAVSDGTYLWIAAYDTNAHIYKASRNGVVLKSFEMNPTGLGDGGAQDIQWDGHHLWISVAQSGGGTGSGLVLAFNPSTEAIDLTVTGQTNVNGLAIAYQGGREYIISCVQELWWGKIDAITGVCVQNPRNLIPGSGGYRVATDNTYVYFALWAGGYITQYRIQDGGYVNDWNVGSNLNSIAFDGYYLWTADESLNTTISDPVVASIICVIPYTAGGGVYFDAVRKNVWGQGQNLISKFNALPPPSFIPTPTSTITPTYDETLGPILTQIAAQWSPTQTLTMTPTSTSTTTITATFTATPTVTPGSHVLNGQNLVSIDTVISSPIGYQRVNWSTTLSWNPYSYTDLVQVFQVPVSTKLKILQGTNYLDIYVTDYLGNTVDCSATNALLGLMLLHN